MPAKAVIVTILGACLLIVGLAMVGTSAFSELMSGRAPGANFVVGLVMVVLGGVLIYVGPGLGGRHVD